MPFVASPMPKIQAYARHKPYRLCGHRDQGLAKSGDARARYHPTKQDSRMIREVVKAPLWAIFRLVSRFYLVLSKREYRYVFILGHVRSGSTLLAHILANHPNFVGAGESHISYRTADDLPKLVLQTCKSLHRPILRETYVVDQINHPYVTNEVLVSGRVYKCIILIREPEATLKSIMKLLKCQEQEALDVYISRLEALTEYGVLLGKRALLVEYDDLVDHTDHTLAALTSFLGLDSPLLPTYATHRMTGREGYGDPSTNIRTGHIIRTPSHAVAINKDILTLAARAFHKCRGQLQTATVPAMSH